MVICKFERIRKEELVNFLKVQLPRYAVVVLVASLISWLLTTVISWLGIMMGGLIGILVVSIGFLLLYLITINQHPGIENVLTDIVPIFLLAPVVYGIFNSFGVTIPTLSAGLTLGFEFATAIVSILIADTLYLRLILKRC